MKITQFIPSLVSLVLIFSAGGAARGAVIFDGVDATDQTQVTKMHPDLMADKPKKMSLDLAIKYLMKSESYAKVSALKTDEGQYIISAEKLKTVNKVLVSGNSEIETEDILLALGIKSGARFDSGRLVEAGEKLKEFYGRKGYLNTIVSFDFQEEKKDSLNVYVKITERTPCLIRKIIIETENVALNDKLQARIKKLIGKNFTEANTLNIENAITEYLGSKRYINSQLLQKSAKYNTSRTSVDLIYELTDPYAYEVVKKSSDAKDYASFNFIRSVDFDSVAKGSMDVGLDISQSIKNRLVTDGRPHARVLYNERTFKSTFTKRIYLDIDEGPKVKITSIDVVGRISQPAKVYSHFIRKNSSDIVADGIFVKADIENGFKNLTTHLNNQGYLKAKVQSSRVEYNDKKDKCRITVILDEGPLTILSNIKFFGLNSFTEAQLLEVLNLKYNSPLRLNELETSIENLKRFYADRGFIEMILLNENDSLVEYDEKELLATLQFKIAEGPQVFVKSVVIEGNSFTKDYVISREAGISVGDLVTPELIEETQKRLDKLAIFARVEVKTLEAGTEISQRTLVISVTERNPGLFKFGAGITNKRELTARGFTGISYNNIGGTARAVSLRGTLENNIPRENYLEYEVGVSYLEPFLFDARLRGRAGYTRSEKIFDESDSGDAKLQATDSFKFALEKDITTRMKFSWLFWGFDSVEQFNLPESGARTRESRQEIAYVGPSLDLDYTDNLFLPTMGHYTKLDAEYSAPEIGSSDKIQFVRTQGSFTHYLPIGSRKRTVWANSLRGGYVKNLSPLDGSGVPQSFAFFLGGYTTLRGYSGSYADRNPNNREFPYDDSTQLIIPKESTFYLIKSELRFPIWKDPLAGALFFDGGQVDVQGFEFHNPFRRSYGIGIRYNTPVGAVSLDYGRKIAPIEGESPDQWHLSIGTF